MSGSESSRSGQLRDTPLPLVLHQAFSAQLTGAARIEARIGQHEIYFRDGWPVAVQLPGSAEPIGKVLLELKLIDEATHRQTLAAPPPPGVRYGQVLLERRLVTPEQLKLALKAQVRRKLHRIFFLPDGVYRIDPGPHTQGLQDEEPLRVHPWRAIYQGVRSAWDATRLEQVLFLVAQRAVKCTAPPDALARYGMGADDARVGELLCRGFWSLPDLIDASGLAAQPVQALVYALYATDALEVRKLDEVPRLRRKGSGSAPPAQATAPPAAPASRLPTTGVATELEALRAELEARAATVESETLFQVLGLSETAGPAEVKTAYFQAAKRYHPDRLASQGLEALRPQVEQIFRRVSEAYATLFDDQRRAAYLDGLRSPTATEDAQAHGAAIRILEAEMAFRRGESLLRNNDYAGAVRELEQAVAGNPDEGEHLACLAWARVCAGQIPAAEAREPLERAIELSPRCGRAHYYLGLTWKQEGEVNRALGCFQKACELDQRLLEAEREVRLIVLRKERDKPEKRGLFDRFRKK